MPRPRPPGARSPSRRGRALLVGLALALTGCPSAETAEEVSTPAAPVYSVSVAEARVERVVDPVTVTGVVAPKRDVTVLAEGAGRLTKLPVALGQRVDSGATLARLDSTVARAQLDQAEAAAEQAAAALELAQAENARVLQLHSEGASTDRDRQNAGIAVRTASAQLQAAQAAVSLAERALRDTTVRAPFAGQIAAVHVELGAVIAPGTPTVGLVDLSEAIVEAGVSGREVPLVAEGQTATVRIPSLGEQTFEGRVAAVAPSSDPRTRTWPIEVNIPNPDRALRGGMVARVEVVVGERQGVLVPDGAIVEGADGPRVFVVAGDRAQERAVALGRSDGGSVEIRTGVEPGELVAVLGSQRLSDGAQVSVYDMGEPAAKATLPPTPE